MVDFHIHTTCTDGMLSREQIIEKAIHSGLTAIALTDHNYIHEDLGMLRRKYGSLISLVNGIELSTKYSDTMRSIVARNQRDNEGYINDMCAKLRKHGLDMPMYDGMRRAYPHHQRLSRLQLADYMVKQGFVGSIDEAFEKYIGAHGEKAAYTDPLQYADILLRHE